MSLTKTPICDFGKKAEDFKLKSINNELVSLENIKGTNGTLIMFICNHCPYVKAIIKDLVEDCKNLRNDGINSVAIMSNDTKNYPEDSFDNMIQFAKDNNFEEIDLMIVNFYPFEKTLEQTNNHLKIIENIAVGGPTMVRAAAKNYNDVTVVTSSNQYEILIKEIETN